MCNAAIKYCCLLLSVDRLPFIGLIVLVCRPQSASPPQQQLQQWRWKPRIFIYERRMIYLLANSHKTRIYDMRYHTTHIESFHLGSFGNRLTFAAWCRSNTTVKVWRFIPFWRQERLKTSWQTKHANAGDVDARVCEHSLLDVAHAQERSH